METEIKLEENKLDKWAISGEFKLPNYARNSNSQLVYAQYQNINSSGSMKQLGNLKYEPNVSQYIEQVERIKEVVQEKEELEEYKKAYKVEVERAEALLEENKKLIQELEDARRKVEEDQSNIKQD